MCEVEPDYQTLVGADKIHLLDNTIRQPPATAREISILADANIFRPKDQLN